MELAPPDKCSRKVSPCGKKSARVKFAYGIADNVTLPASSYQTQRPLPVATGNGTLKWDAENRLIEVDRADGTKVCYSYDAQSRRISKKVGSGTATRYIYDGWNIIAEYNGATLAEKYTWGMDLSGSMQGAGGVGGLLAVEEGGSVYYPTYDGNGNVSEYLDSSGAVQAHYEYDAFGNTTYSAGAKKADFAHRFSTKPLDAETGLYYYGYRYYNPNTGSWLSRDLIGELGGANLYRMVENDAVKRIDVLGLCDPDNPQYNSQVGELTRNKLEEGAQAREAERGNHLNRNQFNECPECEPEKGGEDNKGREWKEGNNVGEVLFYGNYSCCRSGNFQCCYNSEGGPIKDGPWQGIYDFEEFDPEIGEGKEEHYEADVKPHFEYGDNYRPLTKWY